MRPAARGFRVRSLPLKLVAHLISHSVTDNRVAAKIARKVESSVATIFLDDENIEAGAILRK